MQAACQGLTFAPARRGRAVTSPTAWGLAASQSTARSSRRARPARPLPAGSARRSAGADHAAAALEQTRMGVAAVLAQQTKQARASAGRGFQPEARRTGHPVHGQLGQGHQRQPVLHLHGRHAVAGRPVRACAAWFLTSNQHLLTGGHPCMADTLAAAQACRLRQRRASWSL